MTTIVIASGKGGTGKTLVSVNLFSVMDKPISFVDCDVEEPNAHLFLKPTDVQVHTVNMKVPRIDESKCVHCGICARTCVYNAIVCSPDKVMVFDELCHSCLGCARFCPNEAISFIDRPIGVIEQGRVAQKQVFTGRMAVGELKAPPLIKDVKNMAAKNAQNLIIDAPPGTSCSMVEALKSADYLVLVTEPTPFGLHDLELSVEVARSMEVPMGIITNKSMEGATLISDYCQKEKIVHLGDIPYELDIARIYSQGGMVSQTEKYKSIFTNLYKRLQKEIEECAS